MVDGGHERLAETVVLPRRRAWRQNTFLHVLLGSLLTLGGVVAWKFTTTRLAAREVSLSTAAPSVVASDPPRPQYTLPDTPRAGRVVGRNIDGPTSRRLMARSIHRLAIEGDEGAGALALDMCFVSSRMGWDGPGSPTVLPRGTQHGVHIESVASESDKEDLLRVLAEWLNTQEIKTEYHAGGKRNVIGVWSG